MIPRYWLESAQAKAFVMLLRKLFVFVLIPFTFLYFFFGYRLKDLGFQKAAFRLNHLPVVLIVSAAIIAFQYFFGNATLPIREGQITGRQLLIGLPLCFAWLVIEVGFVEEFFFRTVLQSRLAAFFKSESAGIVLMCLIFGLAHAPGLILRGAGMVEGLGNAPSAFEAIAYSIATISIGGILFGVIWMRTKNLFAL